MKRIICLLALVLCLSCGSNKNYHLPSKGPNVDFSGTFSATSIIHGNLRVSRIFNLDNPMQNDLSFSFDPSGDLKISCENALGGENFVTFKGKSKKRYYEIFLDRKRIPFAPVYSITKVSRIRLRISKDGKIIIDHYQNNSGMILLMAAGHSSRTQYQLNKIQF